MPVWTSGCGALAEKLSAGQLGWPCNFFWSKKMDKTCSTVLHLNGILFKVCRWILLIPLCDTLWQSLTLAQPAKTSACWRERVRTAALDPTDRTPAFGLHMFRILYEVSHIHIYIYIWCSISRLFTLFAGEAHHFQVLSPFWLLGFHCSTPACLLAPGFLVLKRMGHFGIGMILQFWG